MAEAKSYRNFIDGEWVESAGHEVFEWMGDPKRSASCLEVARLLGRRSAPEARA